MRSVMGVLVASALVRESRDSMAYLAVVVLTFSPSTPVINRSSASSGSSSETGSSSFNKPRSTACIHEIAVIIFVHEKMGNI